MTRDEVHRNLRYNFISHCRENGRDHGADYVLLGDRGWDLRTGLKLLGVVVGIAALAWALGGCA